jgi:hypothetical protein
VHSGIPPDSYRGYRGYRGLLPHSLCRSTTANAPANGTSRETVTANGTPRATVDAHNSVVTSKPKKKETKPSPTLLKKTHKRNKFVYSKTIH